MSNHKKKPIPKPAKELTFLEACQQFKKQALEQQRQISLLETESQKKQERLRLRKLTHPNLPDVQDREYTYDELQSIIIDYRNSHPLEMALLIACLSSRQKDVDFCHAGNWSKAVFYPSGNYWTAFRLMFKGEPITAVQQELNEVIKYWREGIVKESILIENGPCSWDHSLNFFQVIHKN